MKIAKQTKIRLRNMVTGIIIAFVCFIVLFPLAWLMISSLKPLTELFTSPPSILPSRIVVSNYINLFEYGNFGTYFKNSVICGLGATGLTLLLAVPGAYSLARFRYRGRKGLANFTLLTYMFPRILLSLPLFLVFRQLGLINNFLGLILAHVTFSTPFTLWLLWGFFSGIPKDFEESAMVDGASRLEAIWMILLPLALPGIVTAGVFSFVYSWNDFLMALVLTTSEGMRTLPVGTANFIRAVEHAEWGMCLAASVLSSVPLLLFYVFIEKYLERGIAFATLKG